MADFCENKIRYLEMIQAVVTRMESNSFFLKGGTVTLVAGVFALSSTENKALVYIVFPLIISLWLLDSYYLSLQRKYRTLFDYVRMDESASIDFDLDYRKADVWEESYKSRSSFLWCLTSRTELTFYAMIMLIVLLLVSLSGPIK